MTRIRQDATKAGPGWTPVLEWYAKAIRALIARDPEDRTSWRYLAGIHGFDWQTWLDRGIITPDDSLPPPAEWNGRMWNQCQHGGWYFLPWHRGYLAAFEAIIAHTIEELDGPSDWALPYWNYFDDANPKAKHIPDAFLDPTLPDGSDNPLSAPPRSGTVLGPTVEFPEEINLDSMQVRRFTTIRRLGVQLPASR